MYCRLEYTDVYDRATVRWSETCFKLTIAGEEERGSGWEPTFGRKPFGPQNGAS